jgi:hypothetical protein
VAAVSIPLVSVPQEPMPLTCVEQPSAGTEFLGQLEGLIGDSAPAEESPAEAIPSAAIFDIFPLLAGAGIPAAFGMPSAGAEAGDGGETVGALSAGATPEILDDSKPAIQPEAEMAFAVRMVDQATPETTPEPGTGKNSPQQIPPSAARVTERLEDVAAADEPTTPQNLAGAASHSAPQPAAATVNPNAGNIRAVETTEAPQPAAAIEPATPAVKPAAKEVTEISLSVGARPESPAQERIAIRMVQRGGEVHVSVRTPDPELTQSLRQNLARLSSALDDAGFRVETWRPAEQVAAAPRDFSQDTSHRHQPDPDARSGYNGRGQQNGRQQRRNPDDRPRWAAELASQRIQ